MNLSVTIPCRKYLKLYLGKKKGIDLTIDPFPVRPGKCPFSVILLEPIKKGYQPLKGIDPVQYDSHIEFQLPAYLAKEKRFFVDLEVVRRVDRLLKEMFDDEIHHHVNMRKRAGIEIQDAILDFLDYYGIYEEVLAFETMKKRNWRKAGKVRSVTELVHFEEPPIIQLPKRPNISQLKLFG